MTLGFIFRRDIAEGSWELLVLVHVGWERSERKVTALSSLTVKLHCLGHMHYTRKGFADCCLYGLENAG